MKILTFFHQEGLVIAGVEEFMEYSDISRTRQYAMKGIAFQSGTNNLDFVGFLSEHKRDAVLNRDGSFATFITLYPRSNYGLADENVGMTIIF